MAFWEDDIDTFFEEFGEDATIGENDMASDISVIFDEAGEEMNMNGEVIIYPVSCIAKTTDVAAYKKGDYITVRGAEYILKAHPRPDGTGISRMFLQEKV